jgi:shikimate kinase
VDPAATAEPGADASGVPGVDRPVCVLVGAPGAGKTTVGRLLAARLGVEFADTDEEIERAAGKPISDIFVDDGEEHFRALERVAVAEALATRRGVLALGGGAVLAEATRELLLAHLVVFLSVELPDAAKRTGLSAARPLLAINPRATMRQLLAERRPLYEEVADVVVPTDRIDPEQVTETVLAALNVLRAQS